MRGAVREAMFYRVEMDVIQVGGIAAFIANGVFPEATLPDAPFAFRYPAGGAVFCHRYVPGKVDFYRVPSTGEIGVAFRQSPNAMHVIWKDHPGVDVERRTTLRLANRVAENVYVLDKQAASTVV